MNKMKINQWLLNTLSTTLILLMGGQLYAQSLSDISFGTDETFEVVTWNIEWFPKNGTATADSVGRIIEFLDVDVLGLQEIDDTTLFRQVTNNVPGYELFIADGWFGGLAYVYKTSTVNIQSIYKIYESSPFWNAFPRSPLVMELTFMGEEIVVINNHFKCCGNGILDMGNTSDEEYRRYEASSLLKEYIDTNFPSSRVIVLGDLNDILTDNYANNVFKVFLEDPTNYRFADEEIASGASTGWSYPGWPSHIDHILITNELFGDLSNPGAVVQTIKVDDFMSGGFSSYDYYISDHRPVGMKIQVTPASVGFVEESHTHFEIFPNPTNGQVSIDLTQCNAPTELSITDVHGKSIYTMRCPKGELIDLKFEGPAGIYLVSLESGETKSVTRLIKE
jgi:endonuclease/exonuclease/phosphatase family metal-dependent hydrolase